MTRITRIVLLLGLLAMGYFATNAFGDGPIPPCIPRVTCSQ